LLQIGSIQLVATDNLPKTPSSRVGASVSFEIFPSLREDFMTRFSKMTASSPIYWPHFGTSPILVAARRPYSAE
jgi:hypothetical protein